MHYVTMHAGFLCAARRLSAKPHIQAEVYLVMRGQGQFLCEDVSKAFAGQGNVICNRRF